jgi:hypothetical protein
MITKLKMKLFVFPFLVDDVTRSTGRTIPRFSAKREPDLVGLLPPGPATIRDVTEISIFLII